MASTTSNKRRIEELYGQVIAKKARFESVPRETIEQEIQTTLGFGDLDDRVVVNIVEGRLEFHQRDQERAQEVKQLHQQLKRLTIAGALALTEKDSDDCKLVNRGTKSSHTSPKDEPAEVKNMQFPFKAIPHSDSFKKDGSALMVTFSAGRWTYANEHDVHTFVHAVLQDAVVVCNAILKKRIGDTDSMPIELSVRREARWGSNRLDHSVVFDLYSALPVFEIETKKPLDKPLRHPKLERVAGQVFNQLLAMKAFGHPNPFGALTTFDETRIVWLDTETTKQVLDDFNQRGMTEDWINQIISKLLIAKKQPLTQSPVRVKSESSPSSPQLRGSTPWTNAEFKKAERQIQMSQALRVHEMLPALVNAILCSLDGFHKAKEPLVKLNENILLDRTALKLGKACYEWGTLKVQCSGKAVTKLRFDRNPVLFVIDFLGSGTTSRAYRAVSPDGKECVVKVYVREYDEANNILLKQKEFNKQAKAAVSREVKMYHKIYPDLKKHVFKCKLNQLHCVVHPFF